MATVGRPVILWISEAVRLVAGFLVLRLLAQEMTPEPLGAYLAIVALVMVLPRVLDGGIPQALAYFIRAGHESGLRLMWLLALHSAAGLLIAAALGWLMRWFPYEDASLPAIVTAAWPVITLLIASETAALLAISTLIPRDRFGFHALATLTPTLLMLSMVSASQGLGWRLRPEVLLVMLACASTAGAAIAWLCAGWQNKQAASSTPTSAGELYRYGLRSYGMGLTKVLAQRFDRLYLPSALGAPGYTHYSLAVSLRDLVVFTANLHALTLRNRQMDLVARQVDVAAARKLLIVVSVSWVSAGAVLAAAVWPAWPSIVEAVFGPAMAAAAEPAALLAFSIGPMTVHGFAWNHLYALKRPGRVTALNTAALVILAPVFIAAMSHQGPVRGAAIGSVVWSTLLAASSLICALASTPPLRTELPSASSAVVPH